MAVPAAAWRVQETLMTSRSSVFFVLCLAAAFVTACGPSSTMGDDDDDGAGGGTDAGPGQCQGPQCYNGCPSGQMTTLRGVVTAPNGIDPVPGAIVYVPKSDVNEFPPEVRCEICDQLTDTAIVATETATDGTFSLAPIPTAENQPPGQSVVIVTQMGRFRRTQQVVIDTPCGVNAAADENFRLPGRDDATGDIPNIAVATGDYDVMECVLLKIGLEQGQFDLYEGMIFPDGTATVGSFDTLLSSLAMMKQYNIIFINCSGNTYENLLADANVKNNIEQYVLSGGRLYVTDWSYDYIEQIGAFSPIIDFAPGASGPAPEDMNAAAIGDDGITTEATVLRPEMAEWLRAVEARSGDEIISEANRVHIEHFLVSWVMQFMVAQMDNVTVWLTGQVSGTGLAGDLPLTTTFDYMQCGRVLYSSYHTVGRDIFGFPGEGGFPSYCPSGPLSPQERVLEYLIFHIADCIQIE
jgi:hypothetical protein